MVFGWYNLDTFSVNRFLLGFSIASFVLNSNLVVLDRFDFTVIKPCLFEYGYNIMHLPILPSSFVFSLLMFLKTTPADVLQFTGTGINTKILYIIVELLSIGAFRCIFLWAGFLGFVCSA